VPEISSLYYPLLKVKENEKELKIKISLEVWIGGFYNIKK